MGDISDILLESSFDDYEYENISERRKSVRCSHCNTNGLAWKVVKRRWVLFEINGDVHSCHGYEPRLEVLKEIASKALKNSKIDAEWRIREKAKERGGLEKLMPVITNDQLIELYACFVRDQQLEHDEPDVGKPISYKNEIQLLKNELLHRMNYQEW